MPRKMRLPNWPWARPGARARLVVSFLVIVLPAFLLLLVGDYRLYSSQRAAGLAECRLAAQAARTLLAARLDQAAAALRPATGLETGADPGLALQAALAGHPEFLDAFLLDGNGNLVAWAPPERPLVLDASLVAQVAATRGPVVSDLMHGLPDDRPIFQVVVPAQPGSPTAGVAGVSVDARSLGEWFAPVAQSGAVHLALYDRKGLALHNTLQPDLPWEARDWSRYPHIQQALAGQEATAADMVSQLDGRDYAGVALPVPGAGWVLGAYRPVPDPLRYAAGRLAVAAPLLALLAGVALLGATFFARWYTAPLARLAEHARSLGRGQLNERIVVGRQDELGDLAAALNGMAQQIEERDRRLRARTGELDGIINQSADGISIHGPEGELLRLNPAGVRILGRSPERLGLSLAEQVSAFHMSAAEGQPLEPGEVAVAGALRGETRLAQELCVETEAGEIRHVAVSASPLSDARGRIYGAVSIFRDTTEAHEAQKEKDDFISLVSHELKTPITSIKGYAQMLLRRAEETGGDDKDLKGLRIINDEVDRMVDLINQLLDVSRLETHRLQLNWDVVDLVALSHDAVDRLQMTADRHTLRLRAPQQPMWVEGDGLRLAQVLGNLLMNAIKYSPGGGPVEITLESQEGRGWVSVRDWGVGIAPEDQPHVFERFYRGKRPGVAGLSGMGLGLYISREIVQRHHGDIVFHSQQGQGTTFLFWLPLVQKDEPGRPAGS